MMGFAKRLNPSYRIRETNVTKPGPGSKIRNLALRANADSGEAYIFDDFFFLDILVFFIGASVAVPVLVTPGWVTPVPLEFGCGALGLVCAEAVVTARVETSAPRIKNFFTGFSCCMTAV
jgi:hypothetical protein